MRAIELIYRQMHMECGLTCSMDDGYKFVSEPYLNPTLFYHNLDHIEEVCVWLLENMKVVYDEQHCGLLWAGMFHDWVDPRNNNAEQLSANNMAGFLENHMPNNTAIQRVFKEKVINIAYSAIMATETHKSDDIYDQWMIDADLIRFTCPDDRFAALIRKEYPETPDDIFDFHREHILKEFLARDPFFYHTPQLDVLAKQNIELQLTAL